MGRPEENAPLVSAAAPLGTTAAAGPPVVVSATANTNTGANTSGTTGSFAAPSYYQNVNNGGSSTTNGGGSGGSGYTPASTTLEAGPNEIPYGADVYEFIMAREYDLDYGTLLSEGWETYKNNWVVMTLTLIPVVILAAILNAFTFVLGSMLFYYYVGALFLGLFNTIRDSNLVKKLDSSCAVSFVYIVLPVGVVAILNVVCLLPALVPYVVGVVIAIVGQSTAAAVIGAIICIPSIIAMFYIGICLSFSCLLMIEYHTRLTAWQCIKASWHQVRKHWWQVFGMFLIIGLVTFLGLLAFIVGVFVTIPIAYATLAATFKAMFATTDREVRPTSCVSNC